MSRDASAVILVCGSHTIRAGLGIHELFRRPTVELSARVGLRKSALPPALAPSNPLSFSASAAVSASATPAPAANGDAPSAPAPPATPPNPSNLNSRPPASAYLVGKDLDEAEQNGEDLEISWPMRKGEIVNWEGMEALWKHLLFRLLSLHRSRNESHVMVVIPPFLSIVTHQRITQIFFEKFNVPGLCLTESPLVEMYAVGTLTGVAIDIGWEKTDVVPVVDTSVQHHAGVRVHVGVKDMDLYLAHVLRQDESIVKVLQSTLMDAEAERGREGGDSDALQTALLDLARHLRISGYLRVPAPGAAEEQAVAEDEGTFDVATALVQGKEKEIIAGGAAAIQGGHSADAAAGSRGEENNNGLLRQEGGSTEVGTVLEFRGQRIRVGSSRFKFWEPLVDPDLLRGLDGMESSEVGGRTSDVQANGTGNGDGEGARARVGRDAVLAEEDRRLGVPEAAYLAVSACDVEKRPLLWENILVTGAATAIKGLSASLQPELARFVTDPTDPNMAELSTQPRSVRLLKVPDYFAEFKERTDLAVFLGATIMAKLVFNDPFAKNYVSKTDYNTHGPTAMTRVTAAS